MDGEGRRIAGVLGAMACVAAGFYLVLRVGFLVSGDPAPPPLPGGRTPAPADAAAALALVWGVAIAARRGFDALRDRGRHGAAGAAQRRYASAAVAARERRVAELAADPARARYAPRVARGEIWDDEDIAYYEDPARTETCAHLRPVERAMRAAGVELRRFRDGGVVARCSVDAAALGPRLAPPVRYAEFYQEERARGENPAAHLICDEHYALIHLLHPDDPEASRAPRFPPERAAPEP